MLQNSKFRQIRKSLDDIPTTQYTYRGSSPYVNFITARFITANFITAIFQNIPEIFGLCVFLANYFITAIFMLYAKYRKKCSNGIISPKNALAKYLANTNFG